jgi:outer membrane protein OmpA-like peptidoglycan-associated protein
MPVVEAGSFSVEDGGAMPGEDDLEEDVSRINEPRRPPSPEDRRDAAVEDFLEMIDRTYRPPPSRDDAVEGRAVELDPVDVIADIVEMSAGAAEGELKTADDTPPDVTPVTLQAVIPPPEGDAARASSIEAAGLGLAVFQAFQAEVTKGDVTVSSQPSRYVHPNTPPDSRFTRVVSDIVFVGWHPRLGVSNPRFKMRLAVEANGHGIRNAKITFVGDESDELHASTFSIEFTASELSLPKETMCKIRYDYGGRWDPVGMGDYRFDGAIDLWADGSVHLAPMRSDADTPTFSDRKIKAVRIASAKRVSATALPSKFRVGQVHSVRFEKPGQAKLSDAQARALKAHVDSIPPTALDLVRQGRVPIVVDGFASTTGSIADNQALARRRREAVMAFLRDHVGTGVTFTGRAEGELASGGPDGTEAAEDRRATVTIWTFHDQ